VTSGWGAGRMASTAAEFPRPHGRRGKQRKKKKNKINLGRSSRALASRGIAEGGGGFGRRLASDTGGRSKNFFSRKGGQKSVGRKAKAGEGVWPAASPGTFRLKRGKDGNFFREGNKNQRGGPRMEIFVQTSGSAMERLAQRRRLRLGRRGGQNSVLGGKMVFLAPEPFHDGSKGGTEH